MKTLSDNLKRYDLFGWDFAALNPESNEETAWYLKHARATGGPVLELACGTGRLLCRIAENGFCATGIDLSESMLAIARENAAQLPRLVREHVNLAKADMCRFDFKERFGLVYIAGNSFRELTTPNQQERCLECVARHLRPDGVFLMSERRFDPAWFADGNRRESDWSEPLVHPRTGESVRRRFSLRLSEDRKWISGEFLYQCRSRDGREREERCPVLAPVMEAADYNALFAAAGLESQAFSGYTGRPDDGSGSIISFSCRPMNRLNQKDKLRNV